MPRSVTAGEVIHEVFQCVLKEVLFHMFIRELHFLSLVYGGPMKHSAVPVGRFNLIVYCPVTQGGNRPQTTQKKILRVAQDDIKNVHNRFKKDPSRCSGWHQERPKLPTTVSYKILRLRLRMTSGMSGTTHNRFVKDLSPSAQDDIRNVRNYPQPFRIRSFAFGSG